MTMKMTLTVHCDACDDVVDTPFEDEEVFDDTQLGDEHETSGLVYVRNYQGHARMWLCDNCLIDHKEEREQHARETGDHNAST